MAGTGEGGMVEGEMHQDLEGRGGMAPLSACPASGHSAGHSWTPGISAPRISFFQLLQFLSQCGYSSKKGPSFSSRCSGDRHGTLCHLEDHFVLILSCFASSSFHNC